MTSLFDKFFRKKYAETDLQKRIRTSDPLKIIVGSGNLPSDQSWIATEINTLDVTNEKNWLELLKGKSIHNIFAEHVWEHISPEQAEKANWNIFKFLKNGGRFRVAVPDGFKPDEDYINYVKPGGHGAGSDDHKILYNYQIMKIALEKVGFQVELLEYWDEEGEFHFTDWNLEHGKVMRSRRFDLRNTNGELKYTSLIVDAIKP
ncbi:MAG: hypothetical protein NT084_15445 [Bacteroidetes bacterium]|nr:hypothetical protein [Bacteroidota bacterium]